MRQLGVVLAAVLAAACGGGDDDGGDEGGDADASAQQGDLDAGGGDGFLMVTNSSAITIAELYVDESDNLLPEGTVLAPEGTITLPDITCGPHEVLIIDDTEVGCLLAAVELCDEWIISSATYDDCEV